MDSGLNRRLSSIFLVTDKGQPREIYRRMCDVYGKACFKAWVKKVYWVETYWLSRKEKVPRVAVRKKRKDYEARKYPSQLISLKKMLLHTVIPINNTFGKMCLIYFVASFIYIYIYIYTYLWVCVCVCVLARLFECVYVCTCTCICVYMFSCACVCRFI